MNSLLFLAAMFAFVALLKYRRRRTSALPLPPGPKRLPIIGNLLDRPCHHAWLTYSKWAKQYCSDIVSMEICGQTVIIVNSIEIARELLERRSTVYSDRPSATLVVVSTIVSFTF